MTTPRILLAEWADGSQGPSLLGGGMHGTACIICGHPTGDCTTHQTGSHTMSTSTGKQGGKSTTEEAAADQAKDVENQREGSTIVGTAADREGEVVVIGAEKEIDSGLYEDASSEQYVTLTKDVVEEFFYPNTKRPAYRTLYAAGQTVQLRALEDHNARVAAAKAGPLEGDALAADLIDNSTLASGTSPGIGALESQSKGSGSK